jgi:hypothetical protein
MKYHPHGSVLFATFSIEQGILLLCNPLCEAIIKSCLARAQFMYPVRVVAFLIEGTHIHLVLVVFLTVEGLLKIINDINMADLTSHIGMNSKSDTLENLSSPSTARNLYFSWIRCVSTNSRNLAIYCHHLPYPNPTFDHHLASKGLFYLALSQNVEFDDGYEQVL